MSLRETHPYNLEDVGRIPPNTKVLVIGTAPPPRFSNAAFGGIKGLDFDFFYGSQDNYFWEFLDQIAEEIEGHNLFEETDNAFKCREIATNFLRRHHVWMRDVLQEYRRKDGRHDKAGDDDIEPPPDPKFTDFRAVIESAPISRFAFTSERAAIWTIVALEQQELINSAIYKDTLSRWNGLDKAMPIMKYIEEKYMMPFVRDNILSRDIEFFVLPSPSGGARSGPYGLTLWRKQKIYRRVLFGS